MNKKLKVLAWGDSVLAASGFGTVSRHVLDAVHRTGRYAIDQLAINYHGEFFDVDHYPYQLSPARLLEPADPFGKMQLFRALARKQYDLLWILNDVDVVDPVVPELEKVRAQQVARGKGFKIIYYYPVDAAVAPEVSRMIPLADVPVTYTEFGRQQTLAPFAGVAGKLKVIGHGCDVQNFFPLVAGARQELRARLMGVGDPNTFVVINVNRNLPRKDIPRQLLAFREFKRKVPNSILYVHCEPREFNIDLIRCCRMLGMNQDSRDVVFPEGLRLADGGVPVEMLNNLYNLADAYFTTTLGEGWGLTITEAMAAGVPVVAPMNSSIPQIIGGDRERGYLYECTEQIWSDNALRPMGRVDDIVAKLNACYIERGSQRQREIIDRAHRFARENTWQKVCKQWVDLFDQVTGGA